ncbi:MAG: hypothetical protein JXB04_13410 [Kiritimatiellae bacterium]|nr:hypothetical protein [Kiritimatiellia bacterium]
MNRRRTTWRPARARILAFCVVFFGFRLGEYVVRKLRRKGTEKNLTSRVTTLLFHILSILGGLVAMMLAFNVAGDWFLLGIIIFLFGVGWASINTLPQQVETINLMLNIGGARGGIPCLRGHALSRGLPGVLGEAEQPSA